MSNKDGTEMKAYRPLLVVWLMCLPENAGTGGDYTDRNERTAHGHSQVWESIG